MPSGIHRFSPNESRSVFEDASSASCTCACSFSSSAFSLHYQPKPSGNHPMWRRSVQIEPTQLMKIGFKQNPNGKLGYICTASDALGEPKKGIWLIVWGVRKFTLVSPTWGWWIKRFDACGLLFNAVITLVGNDLLTSFWTTEAIEGLAVEEDSGSRET